MMEEDSKIAIPGAPNFRDLGGHAVAGGKRVKRGLVFRSDDLSGLTRADVEAMAALGIRVVIDFRTEQDAYYSPDRLPPTVRESIRIPIDAGSLAGDILRGALNRRKTMGAMLLVYKQLARDCTASYRRFFEVLANEENLPLLFHCTAGKDRTGFAAALFLSALGVERRAVVEDYVRSAECLRGKYREGRDYDEIMEPLYTVYPEYIEAAFAVIDERSGGVEPYLREHLGVDIERFREIFTA